MRETIYKYALKNAFDYGKAEPKAVIGKVLAEMPEARAKISELIREVEKAASEVNSFSPEKIKEEIKKFEFFEKKEKEKALPELKNAGKVVLRFAPNPSGPLHLGHCRAAILNDEYARMYKGKMILRFEDTDPARVDMKAYEMIQEDLEWLGAEAEEEEVQSERLDIYYGHARMLIEAGHAYVCTCRQDEFQKLRNAGKECECRGTGIGSNLKKFEKMFSDYREGEAVVRLKTGVDLPDPAMRELVILRISEKEHPHISVASAVDSRPSEGRLADMPASLRKSCYRNRGKRVYPMYNFAVVVDDHLLGITHVLRGKDHITNTRKQEFIYDYFNWAKPEFIHYGLMQIEGLELSTSLMARGIKEGKYTGWDDIRLGTLRAMMRRGIRPEAIRKAILDVGTKDTDISFSWKNLYAYNKALIEKEANRYFFVGNPKELLVESAVDKTPSPPLHPEFPERGKRRLEVKTKRGKAAFFISGEDFSSLEKGKFIRLMEAFNIEILRLEKNKALAKFHSESLEEARKKKMPLIHWVSERDVRVKVLTPEGEFSGFGEEGIGKLRIGDVVQFERFGFVRIDSVGEEIVACFAHK